MRRFGFVIVCLLAGCGDPATDAEKAYELVDASETSTAREKCEAARKVVAVYRERGNQERFEFWQLVAAGKCGSSG